MDDRTFLMVDIHKNTLEVPVKLWVQFMGWLTRKQDEDVMSTAKKNGTMKELDKTVHDYVKGVK